MFGLGPWELIFILIIVIFFYGGKKLSRLGENLGRSVTEFKKAVHDYPSSVAEEQKKLRLEKEERDKANRHHKLDEE